MKTFLSYALAVVGLGMMARTLASAIAGSLSYPAARLLLTNLLRSNPNQAELVCKQTKGTFFEAIGAAIKIAAMCNSSDPVVIEGATRPGYDGAATALVASFQTALGRAKLGALAVGGAMAIAITSSTMSIWIVVTIGLLAAAAAIVLVMRKLELERTLVLARAEVLPEVDRAFLEGRYRPS